MIGGQQNEQKSRNEGNINPQKQMDIEDPNIEVQQMGLNKNASNLLRDIDKEVQEIINGSVSNFVEGQNEPNQMILQQQQSRPSPPLEESISQSFSNPKEGKSRPVPLTNELLRLTKKSTATSKQKERKERQRKVRCYVTNFQPYLPTFMDQIHKQHHKTIIRIGQNYQVQVQSQPTFESIQRPMGHLRIWKGSEEKINKDALKKFRQIYGQNRTQEELILLKYRLQSQSWNDLIKEMTAQRLPGKKSGLVINSNNVERTSTRNK